MASAEQSKQTNVRLPLAYHERLQEVARAQGKAPGTLARELLMEALGGGAKSPPEASGAHQGQGQHDALSARMESLEDRVSRLGDQFHIVLRTAMMSLLEDEDVPGMERVLDQVLGPMPILSRD